MEEKNIGELLGSLLQHFTDGSKWYTKLLTLVVMVSTMTVISDLMNVFNSRNHVFLS